MSSLEKKLQHISAHSAKLAVVHNCSDQRLIKLFPARESLVSDIPAGDGKNDNLFLQCRRSN
jgi:hypothetical protein